MKFVRLSFLDAKAIPRSIWALGLVSLLMDTASESIHSLLPIFIVSVLGASMTSLGVIEGIAEASALMVRVLSGVLSDRYGRHKVLTMIGYGLAALSKPLFPLANSLMLVLFARFIDRVGKGIRGAPRDALMGEIAPGEIRGACFGLRQSMDTIGAFLGPLLAMVGLVIFSGNIRVVLWLAVLPAMLAFIMLWLGVKEPAPQPLSKSSQPIFSKKLWTMSSTFWFVVLIALVHSLARYSEAFLIIRAQASGVPIPLVPFVAIFMNIIYACIAYPAGALSDRMARKNILAIGFAFLIAANCVLAFATNVILVFVGIGLYGVYLGCTQGLFAAIVTDCTEPNVRGTAFGIFNFATGLAMLCASIGGGIIWDTFGAMPMFITSAVIASISLVIAVVQLK